MSKVYFARVKDKKGDHPKYGDDWWRLRTYSNPNGQWGTRAWAEEALEHAKEAYGDDLIGAVYQQDVEPPFRIGDWLTGNIVSINKVPEEFRDDYRRTLTAVAKAAQATGTPRYVSSSFRTRAEQEKLYAKFLAGGPLANIPGTSPHERCLALDIPNARDDKKFVKELNKRGYGVDVPSEKWHVNKR